MTRIISYKVADPGILAVANEYLDGTGRSPHPDSAPFFLVDESHAARIADAYEALPHSPLDPAVRRAYAALKAETLEQYRHLVEAGWRLEPWLKGGQPYANSAEMSADARSGRLSFFLGGDFPDGHLMAETTGIAIAGRRLTHNDCFRAVHDVFGHALYGNPFGPRGEEMAWRTHAAMFSAAALPAMSAETRGQNSWVNFGRHLRGRNLPPERRPYAEQKNVILPSELTAYRRVEAHEAARASGDHP